MSWHPTDLVSDVDLQDYEQDILANFGPTSWQAKRTKALEDWLFPILKGRGFDPFRLITRAEVSAAFSSISGTFADVSGVLTSTSDNDLDLSAVFATVGTDALYLGATQPFRGLFVRMLDTVNAAASVLTVSYYNGVWQSLTIADGTVHASGKTCSGGGSVLWTLPVDWMRRVVHGSDPLYWVKLTVSATPTSGTAVGQIGVIRSSALRAPATFRTLELIFQEAPTGQDGPWLQKAEYYRTEADAALQRALPIVGGEFDTDGSDQLSEDEQAQTAEEAGGGPVVLERA